MLEFLQSSWEVVSGNMLARTLFVLELFLAEGMFLFAFKRRSHFVLRILASLIAYFGVGFFFPEKIGFFEIGAYVTFIVFALSLLLNWFCFDVSFKKVMFHCAGAYGLQGLVTNMSICIRVLFDVAPKYRLLVDFGSCLVIYLIGYFLLVRRCQKEGVLNMQHIKVMLLCLVVLLVADFMSKVANTQGVGSNVVCRVSLSLAIVLALCFQYSSLRVGNLETENSKMEALLKAEQEQYTMSRETIDLVNMKCHDLKHQISRIRADFQGAGSEALKEMEEAVLFYESVAKTGNDALDSILTEKSLFCERYSINLTYIVDGKKMGYIKPSDLYSLLGNAIDNAVECVMKEPDAEKRIIFLSVSGKGGLLSIHLENYCAQAPVFENGLPVTTKEDRQNHGIGVRSIRYLAQKYGGNAVFGAEDNLFTLDIMIPIPQEWEEALLAGKTVG